MKSNPTRFWWSVVALGWAFDLLFWEKAPGINFALYVVLCLASGYLLLRADGHRPARNTILLLPFIAFFSVMTFLRQEPLTILLSIAMTLFLMGVFAFTYLGGRWPRYSLADYLAGFLRLAGSMIARPLGFTSEVRREQTEGPKRGVRQVWPVVRGILIALPVVAIFAALLSSADLIFQQRLDEFIELFKLEDLPEYIFRLVYILVGAYALAGVFLHAGTQSRDEKLIGEETPFVAPFLGFTEAAIVLGSVAVLFLAFVVIQFQYFFGGQANIYPDGFTYSEYARRGFGELVTVAFFSLLLLLGLSNITRRDAETQRRIFSGFGIGLVVLVIVMLVSAFQRLILYETAYGFSRLRTYTHVFIIWLGLLLVVVAVLEILRRERAFALAAVLVSLGFVTSLGLLNVDRFIAEQNVIRATEGQPFDVSYLTNLSDDAVPVLAAAYRSQPLPAAVKEGVGAALTCYTLDHDSDDETLPWQSFHVSRWKSDRILVSLEPELKNYQVESDDWRYQVVAPSGEKYDCYPGWD